jgi:anti-sigma regulatory factor (Ser/Thr protein kinase)
MHKGMNTPLGRQRGTARVVSSTSAAAADVLRLQPVAELASLARSFVCDRVLKLGRADLINSARIGTGELVANAIVHARKPMTVGVARTDAGVLRVSVADESPAQPWASNSRLMDSAGRGLRLVEAVSTAWGVSPSPGGLGKIVWFEPATEQQCATFEDWNRHERAVDRPPQDGLDSTVKRPRGVFRSAGAMRDPARNSQALSDARRARRDFEAAVADRASAAAIAELALVRASAEARVKLLRHRAN